MAIKNLIPGMAEVGKIKIGRKGAMIQSKTGTSFRPPEKLDHFIITTNARDENGDFVADNALMDRLKANGSVKDSSGNLTGIPIRLLYNDPDLNFPTRYAQFSGARCVCTGDGETAKNSAIPQPIKCPCAKAERGYEGKDKCKITGVLSCLIDGSEQFGGCHKFRTTSVNTVKSIMGSLAAIRVATGGRLAFLPLRLIVQPMTTTTPQGQTTTVHIVSVVYPGTIRELQQLALTEARENAHFLLEMRRIEDDVRQAPEAVVTEAEEREIAEEFFPESVTHEQPAAAQQTDPPQEATAPRAESTPPEMPAPQTVQEQINPKADDQTSSPTCEGPGAVATDSQAKALDEQPVTARVPITVEQLQTLLEHKKNNGIENGAWKALVKQHTSHESAKELTVEEADAFIRAINADIPF